MPSIGYWLACDLVSITFSEEATGIAGTLSTCPPSDYLAASWMASMAAARRPCSWRISASTSFSVAWPACMQ